LAYRQVFESHDFSDQRDKLGLDARRLDDRLRGLSIALWVDAEAFPLVAPGNRLRVATVVAYQPSEPTLSVWFEVDEHDDVILRWIEQIY